MPERSFVFVANGEDRLCRWTAKLAAARCFVARKEDAMAGPAADHGLAEKKKVSDVCCRSWRRLPFSRNWFRNVAASSEGPSSLPKAERH
nr:hypothetical protein Itr_chr04CG17450 [Ipomoea trifida]